MDNLFFKNIGINLWKNVDVHAIPDWFDWTNRTNGILFGVSCICCKMIVKSDNSALHPFDLCSDCERMCSPIKCLRCISTTEGGVND